ncbi:MAG: ABC transporter ATP-binding protein [Pseudomonadota bacterium]
MADPSKQPFRLFPLLRLIVAPDAGFFYVAAIYAVAISLFTLAVPISVQILIEAVANTTVVRAVVVLSLGLFAVLALSGFLVALQVWAMEVFERRFFARMTSEIALRLVYADHDALLNRNRDDLMNRFFEIMNLQKTLPAMAVGGTTLVLQTLVGYVVVSFYHPVFFAFSLAHALLVYFVWRVVDNQAIASAVDISSAKLDMADWLESITRNNHFFKARRTIDYALERTEHHANKYLDQHRRHFRYTFTQVIGLLGLYALASAALLGIGGFLVIAGELSLGQLVAAELILGAIFAGLAGFHYYLELYYDLCAGLHKLSQFYSLPLEEADQPRIDTLGSSIRLVDVSHSYRGVMYFLDGEFRAGSCTLVASRSGGAVHVMRNLLQRFQEPEKGRIEVGGHDIRDINVHDLRDQVHFLNEDTLIEGSIADNLAIAGEHVTRVAMHAELELLGLSDALDELVEGLELRVAADGYPLVSTEAMRVKVVQALLMRPRVLVIAPHFDALQCAHRRAIVARARELSITLIFLSNRRDLDAFDRYALLDPQITGDEPRTFETLAGLISFEIEQGISDVTAGGELGALAQSKEGSHG